LNKSSFSGCCSETEVSKQLYYTNTSFNSELVKVKNYALLALLPRHRGTDKTLYKAIADKAGANQKPLSDYLNKNTPWLEKGKKIFEYVKDNPMVIVELALGIGVQKRA
jgi:hypothetical protein